MDQEWVAKANREKRRFTTFGSAATAVGLAAYAAAGLRAPGWLTISLAIDCIALFAVTTWSVIR